MSLRSATSETRRRWSRSAPWLLALTAIAPGVYAQPAGTAFTYQGRLTDAGTPVEGPIDFRFILYNAPVGGSQVGTTVLSDDVPVVAGLFTVPLNFGSAAFAGDSRFLEIAARPGSSTGTYTVFGARQELKPAPHTVFSQAAPWAGVTGKPAGFADNVDNDLLGTSLCAAGQLMKWNGSAWACATDANTTYSVANGLQMSGTTISPIYAGNGSANTIARGDHTHFAQAWNGSTGTGLTITNATGIGLTGLTSGDTSAILGRATATTGLNAIGVRGETLATGGTGVFGVASATTGATFGVHGSQSSTGGGAGVRGEANADTGTSYGVFGRAESVAGRGVYGIATATSGAPSGVHGITSSTNGRGVVGSAQATTGPSIGVFGVNSTTSGYGVVGNTTATAGSSIGVIGSANGNSGTGVFGEAFGTGASVGVEGVSAGLTDNATGVLGRLTGTVIGSSPAAIRGIQGPSLTAYAGYFSGRVHVNGTLSKSGGSFKIDHPLDPENKYLYHSFVESPDMMNVYNGNVVTDGDGLAVVTLPEWFEALNRDFRYQLTVVDDGDARGFVQVKVARKIADNRFTIRASAPGIEVSWQVTGIRKDPFAEKHRIPVEEDKSESERGTYLNPDAWGVPLEKGYDERRLSQRPQRPDPPADTPADTPADPTSGQ